ncbi:MAG: protease inhibitor I42 family protein [Clostridiaceae bacterium]|nr:protease inhibitor I42 family protein [Clostridiaceae bacterium]
MTVSKDSPFIVSLPANRTIAYTWNIKNSIDDKVIQFVNRSWIGIPLPKSEEHKDGADYARQNFYFKPIKASNQKIVMRYEHKTMENNEFFEITFNIKIE